MSLTYRLTIWRHDRLFGHFETDGPTAQDAIQDLLQRLPASEGFRVEAFIARSERRILESVANGMRVLAAEKLFEPIAIEEMLGYQAQSVAVAES